MVNFIAEIGINHNGSVDECKNMINIAKLAGCQYVKIQKRNPDKCVPEEQKNKPKKTPWGDMTYLQYKHHIEFNEKQIDELCKYANNIGISFFASVWDIDSAILMSKYCKIAKLGSASITDVELCRKTRELFDFVIISTGMSTENEIEKAIQVSQPDVVMHTNSTYPCKANELNLNYIDFLKTKWGNKFEIGYSGHESELITTYAAVAKGVTWVERHITLNKNNWGSDQLSSIEPYEIFNIIKGINIIEQACKFKPGPRILFENEKIKKQALRK